MLAAAQDNGDVLIFTLVPKEGGGGGGGGGIDLLHTTTLTDHDDLVRHSPIDPFIHPSIHPSTHPFPSNSSTCLIYPPTCLPTHPPTHPITTGLLSSRFPHRKKPSPPPERWVGRVYKGMEPLLLLLFLSP